MIKKIHHKQIYIDKLKSFQIDCDKCCGLCCTALYFSKMDGFPQDKKAGVSCLHLQNDFKCKIYSKLKTNQMKGCLSYDCFKAGMLVTQLYFDKPWHHDIHIKQQMFEVFFVVFKMRQMLFYVYEVLSMTNNQKIITYCNQLIEEYECFMHSSLDEMINYPLNAFHQKVNVILKQICNHPIQKSHIKKADQNKKLCNQNFSMMSMIKVDLSDADLKGANFLGSDVRDANVNNADLRDAMFLTQMQLNAMHGNMHTSIPTWLNRPYSWND